MEDLLNPVQDEREGDDLLSRGLYPDMPAWGCHLFTLSI
jgi:hypothetical protein